MRRGLCTLYDQSPSALCLGNPVTRDLHVVIGRTLAQAAGRSRLLRPGQANFVFWGRLLQGGHVCPESLREFMV